MYMVATRITAISSVIGKAIETTLAFALRTVGMAPILTVMMPPKIVETSDIVRKLSHKIREGICIFGLLWLSRLAYASRVHADNLAKGCISSGYKTMGSRFHALASADTSLITLSA
jgi:hypothetical protein